MLEVKVYYDDGLGTLILLASSSVFIKIAGAVLSIDSPNLNEAEVGVEKSFVLSASGVQSSEIKFGWSFGVGSGGTGSETVQVVDGKASISISHTYTSEGGFGLVADIRNMEDNNVVADSSIMVVVGEKIEREYDLDACNTWKAANSGGQGVTIDSWDISTIPPGAIFDMDFDMFSIPDKILVQYLDNLVADTGWRGATSYNGDMFPGGIIPPGQGSAPGMFTRVFQDQDYFLVLVIGPKPGTGWNYKIRCRFNSDAGSDGQSQSQIAEINPLFDAGSEFDEEDKYGEEDFDEEEVETDVVDEEGVSELVPRTREAVLAVLEEAKKMTKALEGEWTKAQNTMAALEEELRKINALEYDVESEIFNRH